MLHPLQSSLKRRQRRGDLHSAAFRSLFDVVEWFTSPPSTRLPLRGVALLDLSFCLSFFFLVGRPLTLLLQPTSSDRSTAFTRSTSVWIGERRRRRRRQQAKLDTAAWPDPTSGSGVGSSRGEREREREVEREEEQRSGRREQGTAFEANAEGTKKREREPPEEKRGRAENEAAPWPRKTERGKKKRNQTGMGVHSRSHVCLHGNGE